MVHPDLMSWFRFMCIPIQERGIHCLRREYFLDSIPCAFELTYHRAEKHPNLNFTAVVNPASGPGNTPEPDGNYTRDIPRLNSYPNIRTVGYVSTSWTNRNLSLALADISTYSKWATNATIPNLGMRGIFLDETPATWTAESQEYLENIATAIRSDAGLGSDPLVSDFGPDSSSFNLPGSSSD